MISNIFLLPSNDITTKTNSKISGLTIPEDFPKFVIEDNGGSFDGFLLGGVFSANPSVGSYNFLLDKEGKAIFYEEAKGMYFSMHPSGLISAPRMISGNKNIYKIYDNDFNLIDSVQMANGYFADSHDFKILPNGHYLMVSYNDVEIDMSKIVEGGHPNANVTQAIIQELDANKNPVFQWKSLDYIPITDSYNDLTAKNIDYIHLNSMFIDDNGDLLLSCRSTSEILKVSRQTGEIIWRFGGKHNEFSFLNEHEENAPTYFCWQHDAKFLPNGNLLFFDNGSTPSEQTREYSRAVEYELDEVNKTAKLVWEYRHTPDISTYNEGSAERLPNGNTLINWGGAVADGAPIISEVDSLGNLVYEVSCTSQDIRAYIEKVLWRVEDNTVRDTIRNLITQQQFYFKDSDTKDLGISFKLTSIAHFSGDEIRISYYDFAPVSPEFMLRAPNVLSKKFIIDGKNITSMDGTFELDTKILKIPNPEKISVYKRNSNQEFKELGTVYLPSSNKISFNINGFGEHILSYNDVNPTPFAPNLKKPENREIVNQYDNIKLKWSPIGFIQQFVVEIATEEEFLNIIDSVVVEQKDYYDFSKAVENKDYYWRVSSVNEYGSESDWSETRKFTTAAPFINMIFPTGGELLEKTASRHIIRWEKNSSDTVRIELRRNNELVSVIKDKFFTTTNAYPWTIAKSTALNPDYTIRIVNLKDTSVMAESGNFSIVDSTVGIDEINNNSGLTISTYPNPAKNSVRFEFYLPVSGNTELSIFNAKGELIEKVFDKYFEFGNHYFDFNLTKFISGQYFYQLSINNQSVIGKLSVVK